MDYRPPLKPTTKREAIKAIDAECMDIMARKNKDYGNDNIGRFGLMGIVVRLNDKLERLIQLTDPCRQGGPAVKDESIRDTMLDARNYAEIALLFMDGNWGLPWDEINTPVHKPPVSRDPDAPCPLARDGRHNWKIDGAGAQHCLNCKAVRRDFCPPHSWKRFDGVEVCVICGMYREQLQKTCRHKTKWQTDHGTHICEDCGKEISSIEVWDHPGPCEYEPGG
jgi:hypothetical protein